MAQHFGMIAEANPGRLGTILVAAGAAEPFREARPVVAIVFAQHRGPGFIKPPAASRGGPAQAAASPAPSISTRSTHSISRRLSGRPSAAWTVIGAIGWRV
jgi:hypothetical protein